MREIPKHDIIVRININKDYYYIIVYFSFPFKLFDYYNITFFNLKISHDYYYTRL